MSLDPSDIDKLNIKRKTIKSPFFSEISAIMTYILSSLKVNSTVAKSICVFTMIFIEKLIVKSQQMRTSDFKNSSQSDITDLVQQLFPQKHSNMLSRSGIDSMELQDLTGREREIIELASDMLSFKPLRPLF